VNYYQAARAPHNAETTRKDLERLVESAAQMGAMMAAELKKC
jgi:hypothetical protein